MSANKERRFDLVLFDLDGTLIDSLPQLADAVNCALQEQGEAPVHREQVRNWVGNGVDMLLKRALSRSDEVAADWSEAQFARARAAFDRHYQSHMTRNLALYPGVAATLDALAGAGCKLAVVTNKPTRFVASILEESGIEGFFCQWLGGDCLPVRKPDPAPLLHICEQQGVAPERTLMVGDSRNDILAAQAAAMASVGLTYGYNYGKPISDSNPDWVLDDFSRLETILSGGN